MRPPRSATSPRNRSRWAHRAGRQVVQHHQAPGLHGASDRARARPIRPDPASRAAARSTARWWRASCAQMIHGWRRESRRLSRLPPWPYGRKKRWRMHERADRLLGAVELGIRGVRRASARTDASGSRCDCRSSALRHARARRARDARAASFSPMTKNVDLMPRRASASSTSGVTSGGRAVVEREREIEHAGNLPAAAAVYTTAGAGFTATSTLLAFLLPPPRGLPHHRAPLDRARERVEQRSTAAGSSRSRRTRAG